MKIAFIDPITWNYTPLAPSERPMGGTQSAIAYLGAELVKRGHQVALVNHIDPPGSHAGIDCPGMEAGLAADYLNRFTAVVAVNGAMGRRLRAAGVTSRLVLWTGHAADQGAVAELKHVEERASWDGFFVVSDWQAKSYTAAFGIPAERMRVLRNAVAPAFQTLKRTREPFFKTGEAPVLFYTSTPFRGLTILLLAFPAIRAAIPDCRLKVYSSMSVYNVTGEEDEFRVLYEVARALPGSEYVGSLPQGELAEAMASADILAYPNYFAETSCIAVMEAMAAGCLVVTSQLGALPETTANFGFLMPPNADTVRFAHGFAQHTIEVIRRARARPEIFADHLARQQSFARKAYDWSERARDWELALGELPLKR